MTETEVTEVVTEVTEVTEVTSAPVPGPVEAAEPSQSELELQAKLQQVSQLGEGVVAK